MPPLPDLTAINLPVLFLIALTLSVLFLPPCIRWLKSRQIGQFIREEGPPSHSVKAKTPTMGGACTMAAFGLASALWLAWVPGRNLEAATVVEIAILAGAIGAADDLAKINRRENAGISARLRLVLETALGLVLAALLLWQGTGASHAPTAVILSGAAGLASKAPVTANLQVGGFLLLSAFLLAATTNALNLHDGMDGLAAGTALQVLLVLAVLLSASGQGELAAVAAAGAGAVGGFLIFNRFPAAIFMGDTGSLFLGGLIAALVVAGGLVVWFVPLALVYIAETISVIVQVAYFKLTKEYQTDPPLPAPALAWLKLTRRLPGQGKRLLRMAPLHHHFEAVAAEHGKGEWEVVACFWLAQLALSASVILAFYNL